MVLVSSSLVVHVVASTDRSVGEDVRENNYLFIAGGVLGIIGAGLLNVEGFVMLRCRGRQSEDFS